MKVHVSRSFALGAVLAALLGFATAIEYGAAPAHAVLASDGTAIGHNMAATTGDGTALGLGRQ